MRLFPGVEERIRSYEELAPARLAATRVSLSRAASQIHVVDSADAAEEMLAELRSMDLGAIAVDSEYSYDRPGVPVQRGVWHDIRSQRPICFSLAAWAHDGSEEGYLVLYVVDVRRHGVVAALEQVIRLRTVFVFHHAKVELFSLWALGLDPDLLSLYDTFVAACAVDLGLGHKRSRRQVRDADDAEIIRTEAELEREKKHGHSLVGLCRRYGLHYPYSDSKEDHQSRFLRLASDEALTETDIEYAAADAEWTLRVYVAQQPDVQRRGLASHLHKVEFPFVLANARIEWRGVHVGENELLLLSQAARQATDHIASVLAEHGVAPPGSRNRFLSAMDKAGLGHHFVHRGRPSTEDDILETLEDLHPAIGALRKYRRYSRLAGEEWLTGSLVGADGRIHPDHRQLGAATGRNSCSRPNIAGIGRALRPVVTAPGGRGLVELDYSQIEVGVAAAEHDDLELIEAFNSGDVYAAMAMRFYSGELDDEDRRLTPAEFRIRRPALRDKIKTFVLAVIYNIQAPAIAARFGISVHRAEQERKRFLDTYPSLRAGLEASAECGMIRGYASMVGGLRRCVEVRGRNDSWTRNFLRNTPIQGSATVVFKKAVVDLDCAFRGTGTWVVLPVHDSVLIECRLEDIESVADRAARIMREAVVAYYPRLKPRVEVNRGAPWCWNKDGAWQSLEQFREDPEFRPAAGPVDEGLFEQPVDATLPEWVEAAEESPGEFRLVGDLLEIAQVPSGTLASVLVVHSLDAEIQTAEERAAILEFEGDNSPEEARLIALEPLETLFNQLLVSAGQAQAMEVACCGG